MSVEVVESPSVMVSPFPSIALSIVSTTIGSSIVQVIDSGSDQLSVELHQ